MPTATASDVFLEIDTDLADAEIEGDENDPSDDGMLGPVSRDVDRMSSPPADGTDDRKDLEAVLCALRIATGNAPDGQDRTAQSVSSGRTQKQYDASTVEKLKQRARFLGAEEQLIDPGNQQADFEVF